VSALTPCRRIPSDLKKSNGFCHSASIPTYVGFLGYHNWSQISGVPDGQMALYGIAALFACAVASIDVK
jgi:hypothetical protein